MADFDKLSESSLNSDSQLWRKKEPQTYKDIVLKQIELCRIEQSKQMIGNSTFYQKGPDGSFQQFQLLDQRKVFIQCVMTLHDLMLRYFDQEIKDNITGIMQEIFDKQKNNLLEYIKTEKLSIYKNLAETSGIISNTPTGTRFLNDFEAFRYNQYRKIFQELLLLFDRKNELSNKKTVSIF